LGVEIFVIPDWIRNRGRIMPIMSWILEQVQDDEMIENEFLTRV